MKLCGNHVTALYGRINRHTVMGSGGNNGIILSFQKIGVNEINIGILGNSLENAVMLTNLQRVPAHVRDFQSAVLRGDFRNTALEDTQTFGAGTFLTAIE